MRSGKVFAMVLSALVIPQLLPAPVMKPNRIRSEKLNMERDVASSGIPLSKIYRIPEYPPRRQRKAHTNGIRVPRESTIRPTTGPLILPPTERVSMTEGMKA